MRIPSRSLQESCIQALPVMSGALGFDNPPDHVESEVEDTLSSGPKAQGMSNENDDIAFRSG